MKVTTSSKYQKRAKAQLKKMIKNNDFKELGKIALWNDATFSEKEVAEILLKDLKEDLKWTD